MRNILELAALSLQRGQDLHAVLQHVTDTGRRLTGAQFGAFFHPDHDEATGDHLDAFVLSGAPRHVFPQGLDAPVRFTDLFQPTLSGATIAIPDVLLDPRYGQLGGLPPGHPPVRSYLATPVVTYEGRVLGALLFAHMRPEVFDEDAVLAAEAVAAHAAVAIDNARSYAAEQAAKAETERAVERLRELAQELQRNLLPRTLPHLPHVEVAVRYQPALNGSQVGGDWYDVVVGGGDQVTFVIGDVQGHNTGAAALMGQLRTAVHAYVSEGHTPGEALARTNALLTELGSDLLATCCLVQLDQRTGRARIASAGHPPPLLLAAEHATEIDVDPGIPLGVEGHSWYDETWVTLDAPATLLLYTDGVVESRSGGADGRLPE